MGVRRIELFLIFKNVVSTELQVNTRQVSPVQSVVFGTENDSVGNHTNDIYNHRANSTSQHTPQQTDPGMLIDMALHVGSLKFKVWSKMTSLLEHSKFVHRRQLRKHLKLHHFFILFSLRFYTNQRTNSACKKHSRRSRIRSAHSNSILVA